MSEVITVGVTTSGSVVTAGLVVQAAVGVVRAVAADFVTVGVVAGSLGSVVGRASLTPGVADGFVRDGRRARSLHSRGELRRVVRCNGAIEVQRDRFIWRDDPDRRHLRQRGIGGCHGSCETRGNYPGEVDDEEVERTAVAEEAGPRLVV